MHLRRKFLNWSCSSNSLQIKMCSGLICSTNTASIRTTALSIAFFLFLFLLPHRLPSSGSTSFAFAVASSADLSTSASDIDIVSDTGSYSYPSASIMSERAHSNQDEQSDRLLPFPPVVYPTVRRTDHVDDYNGIKARLLPACACFHGDRDIFSNIY